MREAVIVSSVRTAVGKAPKGTLRATRPDDLAALTIKESLARVKALDPAEIEDVIIGCAMPEAEAGHERRARSPRCARAFPSSSSAMTVNRFCSSGLQIDRASPPSGSWRGRATWPSPAAPNR